MFDIKKLINEAENEVAEEAIKRAKERIVMKLREREKAKKILANIERELEDLYAELANNP